MPVAIIQDTRQTPQGVRSERGTIIGQYQIKIKIPTVPTPTPHQDKAAGFGNFVSGHDHQISNYRY
jgi:hypothetical protein